MCIYEKADGNWVVMVFRKKEHEPKKPGTVWGINE